MIEICAHCVYELASVNASAPGMYLDYDGTTWREIPRDKVIEIVVVEGRAVKTTYGQVLHPEKNLVLFRGTLLCPDHFRYSFAGAMRRGEVE